jgi:hypothetical protein
MNDGMLDHHETPDSRARPSTKKDRAVYGTSASVRPLTSGRLGVVQCPSRPHGSPIKASYERKVFPATHSRHMVRVVALALLIAATGGTRIGSTRCGGGRESEPAVSLDAFNVDQAGASVSFCPLAKRKQGLGNHKVHHFLDGRHLCTFVIWRGARQLLL